jgi:hypothetical protein
VPAASDPSQQIAGSSWLDWPPRGAPCRLRPTAAPLHSSSSPTQSNPVQPTSSGDLPSNLQSTVAIVQFTAAGPRPRPRPRPQPQPQPPPRRTRPPHTPNHPQHPLGATCRLEASRRITRCTPKALPTILVVRTCPSSPPRVLPCNTPASLCLHTHSCRHSLTQTRRRHSTPAHRISTPPYSRCWHPCCCPAHPPQWAHLPAWWALYSRPQATC